MKKKSMPNQQQQKTQVKTKVPVAVKISLVVMMLAGISLAAGMLLILFEKPQDKTVVTEESSFTVTLQAGDYSISEPDEHGYQGITMDGFDNISEPGEPALPTQVFQVLMPPGTKFTSLEIIAPDTSAITGDFSIKEAPTPQLIIDPDVSAELDYEPVEVVLPKLEIYKSDSVYPQEIVQSGGQGQMRKYNIQGIRFNPFQYKPLSGSLTLIDEVMVNIHYMQDSLLSDEELQDTVMDEEAQALFVNYNEFKKEYTTDTPLDKGRTVYDYVIIAPEVLASSQGTSNLVQYRENQGYSVHVETIENIESTYSGSDLTEKIRDYLASNYLEQGFKYVAIVGTDFIIPMKDCDVNGENLPTDYYYQDLTGTWNSDEYFCGNDIDLYPDVYVGRIPLDDAAQLENYVNRIITFEESENSYKQDVLLAAGRWYYADDAEYTAEYIMNNVFAPNSYQVTRMYEETGTCPTTYPHDYDVSRESIVSHWRDDHYGIVFLASHGQPGQFISEPCSEYPYILFGISNIPALGDQYPSIVFGNACSTSFPEDYFNLGYVLIRKEAVSYVGSTRLGLTNDQIYKYYFENLISNARLNGKALAEARLARSYHPSYGLSESLRFNLYGEPLLDICQDIDNDGYCASVDCDNHNGNVNSGMPEICNGIDDDCNGLVDGQELNEICGNGVDDDCDYDIDLDDDDCDCSVLSEYKCEKNGCSTGAPKDNYWCPVNHYCCRDCRDYFDKSCWCWRNTCDASAEQIPADQQDNN